MHETVVRAKAAGVAELSAVALFKRLRNAEEGVHELCRALLPVTGISLPENGLQLHLRLVDSTTIKEPGKTGSLWRIHYSFQLPEFCCEHFVLSPSEGAGTGDSFSQFPIAGGDHLIGDRGYSPMAEQARLVAALRRARYGSLLALHVLLLGAAHRTPSEIAAVLFCSRSSVYWTVKAYRAGTLTFDSPAAEDASRARVRILTPTLQRSRLTLPGAVPWACGWCRTR